MSFPTSTGWTEPSSQQSPGWSTKGPVRANDQAQWNASGMRMELELSPLPHAPDFVWTLPALKQSLTQTPSQSQTQSQSQVQFGSASGNVPPVTRLNVSNEAIGSSCWLKTEKNAFLPAPPLLNGFVKRNAVDKQIDFLESSLRAIHAQSEQNKTEMKVIDDGLAAIEKEMEVLRNDMRRGNKVIIDEVLRVIERENRRAKYALTDSDRAAVRCICDEIEGSATGAVMSKLQVIVENEVKKQLEDCICLMVKEEVFKVTKEKANTETQSVLHAKAVKKEIGSNAKVNALSDGDSEFSLSDTLFEPALDDEEDFKGKGENKEIRSTSSLGIVDSLYYTKLLAGTTSKKERKKRGVIDDDKDASSLVRDSTKADVHSVRRVRRRFHVKK